MKILTMVILALITSIAQAERFAGVGEESSLSGTSAATSRIPKQVRSGVGFAVDKDGKALCFFGANEQAVPNFIEAEQISYKQALSLRHSGIPKCSPQLVQAMTLPTDIRLGESKVAMVPVLLAAGAALCGWSGFNMGTAAYDVILASNRRRYGSPGLDATLAGISGVAAGGMFSVAALAVPAHVLERPGLILRVGTVFCGLPTAIGAAVGVTYAAWTD